MQLNLEEIKKHSNPYHVTHKLQENEFIGREREVQALENTLLNYQSGSRLQNIIISGEKSIGKSTLLNRYKQLLEDANFVVFEKELNRGDAQINEFEFFYSIINQLYRRYDVHPENKLFNEEQAEIWFSLTNGEYKHGTNYTDRRLTFPTKYANKKLGIDEYLSYEDICDDLKQIAKEINTGDFDFSGLAIIIDEFQELKKNIPLLDTLRRLSDDIPALLLICAGQPTFKEEPSFQKLTRISQNFVLSGFDDGGDKRNLIYGPLQKKMSLNVRAIDELFNQKDIDNIITSDEENPLNIQILCKYMFESFKNDREAKKINLNANVMKEVMNYYAGISENSLIIYSSLNTCSVEKLDIFAEIFQYEGLSLKEIIMTKLSFNNLENSRIKDFKEKLLNDYREIESLQLFKFTKNESVKQIESLDFDALSNVHYQFIGDTIDKLYAYYLYHELTKKDLRKDYKLDFNNRLTKNFADKICLDLLRSELHDKSSKANFLVRIKNESDFNLEDIKGDFNNLLKLTKKTLTTKVEDSIDLLTKRYGLQTPAFVARARLHGGYLLLISKIKVQGRTKYLFTLISLSDSNADKVKDSFYKEVELESSTLKTLKDYFIQVEWSAIVKLCPKVLQTIFSKDIEDIHNNLFSHAKNREFDSAISFANAALSVDIVIKKGHACNNINDVNNFAFCLMNGGDLDKAEEIFNQIDKKTLFGTVNKAFLLYLKGNQYWTEAIKLLKIIIRKKQGIEHKAFLMNLALDHPKLEIKHTVVEEFTINQTAHINTMLIYAQDGEDISKINSMKNKFPYNEISIFVRKRIEYWIKYYLGSKDEALQLCSSLKDQDIENKFYSDAINLDYDILKSESLTPAAASQ